MLLKYFTVHLVKHNKNQGKQETESNLKLRRRDIYSKKKIKNFIWKEGLGKPAVADSNNMDGWRQCYFRQRAFSRWLAGVLVILPFCSE